METQTWFPSQFLDKTQWKCVFLTFSTHISVKIITSISSSFMVEISVDSYHWISSLYHKFLLLCSNIVFSFIFIHSKQILTFESLSKKEVNVISNLKKLCECFPFVLSHKLLYSVSLPIFPSLVYHIAQIAIGTQEPLGPATRVCSSFLLWIYPPEIFIHSLTISYVYRIYFHHIHPYTVLDFRLFHQFSGISHRAI